MAVRFMDYSLLSWSTTALQQYPSKPCNRGLFGGRTGDAGSSPSSFSRWVHRAPPRQEAAAAATILFRLHSCGGFSLLRRELGIALSSFQFPGSPAAIINRNKVPVMCDGILFRRYNVARIRDFALERRLLVVFGAGSGVGTDYSNMEWRLAGVAVAPGLFYRTNGFIKCLRELAADDCKRAEPVS